MKKCNYFVANTVKVLILLSLVGCTSKGNSHSTDLNTIMESDEAGNESISSAYGIDLGLSVNWAECNVGANTPEDAGYCIPYGNVTGTVKAPKLKSGIISGTDADIAVVKMGDGWRMPTGKEIQELLDKCEWTVETINGRNGFRITGSNGNSIFLPNTGSNYTTEELSKMNFTHDTSTNIQYEGNYWCGAPTEDQIGLNHLSLRTDRQNARLMWCELYFCNAVRAVHEK